jgi:hypothetical protein
LESWAGQVLKAGLAGFAESAARTKLQKGNFHSNQIGFNPNFAERFVEVFRNFFQKLNSKKSTDQSRSRISSS